MRHAHVTSLIAVLAFVAAFAPPASADIYAGASFVTTDSEFDVAVDNFDTDDSGYKLYAGKTFIRFLAIEAGYRDLGSFRESSATNAVDADIEVWDLSARGILPLPGRFAVFARAGYANVSVDGTLDLGTVTTDFDEDDWELFYGVGVEIEFGSHLGLRVEWEEYDVDASLNSLSAGAYIRF